MSACSDAAVIRPGDVPDGARLAREAGALLAQLSAYDYALAGAYSGERTRIVGVERWAAVARANARAIVTFNAAVVSASAATAGPVRDRLVALADSLADVARDAGAYADGRQPDMLARLIGEVSAAWDRLEALAGALPADAALAATVASGRAPVVAARRELRYAVSAGPFATRAEADETAKRIGSIESIGTAAPFVIRVGSFPARAAADAAAAALQGVPGATVQEEVRWSFVRSGPAPDALLWREPVRVLDVAAGTRRVAVSSDARWVAAGADDGTVALFSSDGVLRALPKLRVSVAHMAFSDDAQSLVVGGVNLVTLRVPQGTQLGATMELTSPATQLLFVPGPGSRAFVATAKGPTGVPEGGAGVISGRAPDGVALGAPFPIVTPAAGAILAASAQSELYVATPAPGGASSDIEVFRVGFERTLRGVVRVPGRAQALTVDRTGTLGAVLTDKGVYRFGPKDGDPGTTLSRVADSARDVAFGSDGMLYVLEQARLSAIDRDGRTAWTAALTDGRKLVAAARAAVIDGLDRVLVAGQGGALDDLGVGGTVQDLAMSLDGRRIAAVVDARRALIFDLP